MRVRVLSLLFIGLLTFSLSACDAAQTSLGAQELEGNTSQEGQPNAQQTGTPLADLATAPAGTPGQDRQGVPTPLPALEGEPPDALPLLQLNDLTQLESYRRQTVLRYAPEGQPELVVHVITEVANEEDAIELDLDALEHTTVAFFEGDQRTERTQFVWIGAGSYWADIDGTWQQVDFGPEEYVNQSAFGEAVGDSLDLGFLFEDNVWAFPDQVVPTFESVEQADGVELWRYVAGPDQFVDPVIGFEEFTEGQVTAWVNPELAVITRVEGELTNPEAEGGPLTVFFTEDLVQVNQAPDMVPEVLFEPQERSQFQVNPDGTITVPEMGTVSDAGEDAPLSLNADEIRPLTVLETYQRHTVVSLAPQGADGPARRVEVLAASAVSGEGDGVVDETEDDQALQEDQVGEPGGSVLHAMDLYFVEDNQVVGLAQFLGIDDNFWVKDANGWTHSGRTPAEYVEELNYFGEWGDVLDAQWLFDDDVWFLGNVSGEGLFEGNGQEALVGVETIEGQEYWRYEYGHDEALAGFGSFDQFEDGRVVTWVNPTYNVVTRMFVVAIDEDPDVTDFGEDVDTLFDGGDAEDEDVPRPEQEGLEDIQGVVGEEQLPDGVPAGAAVLTIETNITGINEPVTITTPDEITGTPSGAMGTETPQGTPMTTPTS